jgi:ElaB/YqjD/DUF883 family membrane-anchored ribosome-binding protein
MSKTASDDHATTDRLSERAHESVDRIARTAGKGEERIRHEAADAKAHLKEAGEKAREHSEETLHTVNAFVRDNPLLSLGLAFAAGTLLSAFTRKS